MTVEDDARKTYEEWVRQMTPNDLGDDEHRWGWWPWEGDGQSHEDIAWAHRCTNHGGRTSLVVARIDINSGKYHKLITKDPLHIEASVLCPACGDHGFIRGGRWVPA